MFETPSEANDTAPASLESSTRRRALQGLAALVAATSVPRSVFAAQKAGAPAFFTASEMAFITALADTLIPKTDTPGAKEAGVPAGFDGLMRGWASGKRRATTKKALAALRADLDGRVGKSFVTASAAQRLKALEALDADAYGPQRKRYGDYRDIKTLLVRLYYASEPGSTLELRYDPVPGGYDGDVPFEKIGRTWAAVELGGAAAVSVEPDND